MYPGSPADEAGLNSQHDFVFYCLEFEYKDLDSFCSNLIARCKQVSSSPTKLKLMVYNIFHDEVRIVSILPCQTWDSSFGWIGCEFGEGLIDSLRNIQDKMQERSNHIIVQSEVIGSPESDLDSPDLTSKKRPIKFERVISGNNGIVRYVSLSEPTIPQTTYNKGEAIQLLNSSLYEDGLIFKSTAIACKYRITPRDLIHLDRDFDSSKYKLDQI